MQCAARCCVTHNPPHFCGQTRQTRADCSQKWEGCAHHSTWQHLGHCLEPYGAWCGRQMDLLSDTDQSPLGGGHWGHTSPPSLRPCMQLLSTSWHAPQPLTAPIRPHPRQHPAPPPHNARLFCWAHAPRPAPTPFAHLDGFLPLLQHLVGLLLALLCGRLINNLEGSHTAQYTTCVIHNGCLIHASRYTGTQ